METAELVRISEGQIRSAGPRYTPAVEPGAPNIEIESVALALAALARSGQLRDHLAQLRQTLREAAGRASAEVEPLFRGRVQTPGRLLELIEELECMPPGEAVRTARSLARCVGFVRRKLWAEHDRLLQLRQAARGDEKKQDIDRALTALRRLIDAAGEVEEFVESSVFEALSSNTLLLLGAWGRGKTHFLCDLTRRRIAAGLPTLLYLAQNLEFGKDPIDSLVHV